MSMFSAHEWREGEQGLADGYSVYVVLQVGQASRSLRLQTQGDWQENAVTLEGTWESQASGEGAAGSPPLTNLFPASVYFPFFWKGQTVKNVSLLFFSSGTQTFQVKG